ncbi:MAG: hypothetical protein AAF515_16310 [Pseudomonadota bacterium]
MHIWSGRAARRRSLPLLLSGALLGGCASTPDLYLYQGLQPAQGQKATDGVFQDFYSDADTLARIWADPDAAQHNPKGTAWARAAVARDDGMPYLDVEFERAGYGVSVEVAPKDKTPELIPDNASLEFELRSPQSACVGVRMMEHDGEVWGYGKPQLEYDFQCVDAGQAWERFSVPLRDGSWFKFIYGGNTNLGNEKFDGRMVTMLSFEIGLRGASYVKGGRARVQIRNIQVVPKSGDVAAAF